MRHLLTGFVLLYVILIGLTVWASPAAAEPGAATCQDWYVSWQADKTELRNSIKTVIMTSKALAVAEHGESAALDQYTLCMLMNVDFLVNTVLGMCDEGAPLDMAGPYVLGGLVNRCQQ